MKLDHSYIPEYDSLKKLLVQMAQEPSVELLLQMAADGMAKRPHITLTRIWTVEPGDECDHCIRRKECPDPSRCLHLSVAAGNTDTLTPCCLNDILPDNDIYHRRIPISVHDISRVVNSLSPYRKEGIQNNRQWSKMNTWSSGIQFLSISVHPMMHKGITLGVIAVYTQIELGRLMEGHFWLRMVANLAGYAIANAKAMDKIHLLKSQLELENAYLREEISHVQAFGDIIGNSPPLMNVLRQVKLVAPTDATVLILGESGTGKELIAREIHKRSKRSNRPMIRVNCASITRELYESEFFGHIKGAFTGAIKNRAGRFQTADGGTLFLDEISEIPLNLQSKLLRVLQEGTYERIGEDFTRCVDVRIIAATNRDIKKEVNSHQFREDLYYRLNVFPIEIAPLRNRPSDIPQLANHLLKQFAVKMATSIPTLTDKNIKQLTRHNWPGNVRELQNTIERAVILSRQGRLNLDLSIKPEMTLNKCPPGNFEMGDTNSPVLDEAALNDLIKKNILTALERCHWKIYGESGAAAMLEIKPTTLASRMKRFGICRPQ